MRPAGLFEFLEDVHQIERFRRGVDGRKHAARHVILDRKSTRLNSSHLGISYAAFCLKKKRSRDQETSVRQALRQETERCLHASGRRFFFFKDRGPPEFSPFSPPPGSSF